MVSAIFSISKRGKGTLFFAKIFERRKYFTKFVFVGKSAVQWLMKNIVHIVVGINSKQFFTFRNSDTA